MANHHPASELLTAFSAGSLPLSHALCVSTHVEQCRDCNANLQRLNAIGAQLMAGLQPAATTSPELKSNVMAMLDEAPVEEAPKAIAKRNANIPRHCSNLFPRITNHWTGTVCHRLLKRQNCVLIVTAQK
ncbi:hypothetical protein [Oceanicoccus sp. KOV_DT_Chl]|uniref:hypothetical protein n=1 Tax=Oceanicoccus sp. KOV_DT_Chl TaxID=1904639 RepID=UPI001F193097|nr:hypothetical protein [Oceanicoccus sp. KOV_DT_Chl]